LLKHDLQPAQVAEESAAVTELLRSPDESGEHLLKHDPHPAQVAEQSAANGSVYNDPDYLTSGFFQIRVDRCGQVPSGVDVPGVAGSARRARRR
jgi:hypothetical protein